MSKEEGASSLVWGGWDPFNGCGNRFGSERAGALADLGQLGAGLSRPRTPNPGGLHGQNPFTEQAFTSASSVLS